MAAAELVADDRIPIELHPDGGLLDLCVGGIADDGHLLDHRPLLALELVQLLPPGGLVNLTTVHAATIHDSACMRQAVDVQLAHAGELLLAATQMRRLVSDAKAVGGYRLGGTFASCMQVDHLRLVQRAVGEASLHGGLVDDHRVLHVVARVRQHGDDRVRSGRIVVHVIAVLHLGAADGHLRRVKAVHLGIRAVLIGGARSPERLLRHLALVHVARTLVVVGPGRQVRNHAEDGGGLDLTMSRRLHIHLAPHVMPLWHQDVHRGLLQAPNHFDRPSRQLLHGPHESGRLREDEDSRKGA
eukprot:scaffold7820_cov363-Prasinococcus_capsulatus_cf.AAC.5